jgi:hypothetical protein
MIIYDLNFPGVRLVPDEAYAVSIVDSDAMLSCPVSY